MQPLDFYYAIWNNIYFSYAMLLKLIWNVTQTILWLRISDNYIIFIMVFYNDQNYSTV